MTSFDIVDLITNNPIAKLRKTPNNSLINGYYYITGEIAPNAIV